MKTFLFLIMLSSFVYSQKLELVAKSDGVIWGMDFVSSNQIVFTHRDGSLKLLELTTKKITDLKAPKAEADGQGGLLDVLFHKGSENEYLYMSFSEKVDKDKVVTSLARGVLKDNKLENLKTIFQSSANGSSAKHFGSRIVIKDDQLFLSIGERGERDEAQKLTNHNGTVLRLTLDGRAYPGNPFKEHPFIYSYGHRNPQGMDLKDGILYAAEMGPRGGDELNIIKKGANYGWPVITYGREYWGPKIGQKKKDGMEQPLLYWTPSISPSGMAFYTGDKIKKWNGDLFIGCLSGEQVRRVDFKDGKVVGQESLFEDQDERFRDVLNGDDGFLYVSTDSGKIYKIK
ncbi:MAG: PQQ-dependent sugar dehydrogenase [Bacteriovoracaceae bacterium]|nr:PQQ-dependent sugar dehydrogenase [Bacteriovoracaceae bacterium]